MVAAVPSAARATWKRRSSDSEPTESRRPPHSFLRSTALLAERVETEFASSAGGTAFLAGQTGVGAEGFRTFTATAAGRFGSEVATIPDSPSLASQSPSMRADPTKTKEQATSKPKPEDFGRASASRGASGEASRSIPRRASRGVSAAKIFVRAETSGVEQRGHCRSSAVSGFGMRIRTPHPSHVTTTGPIVGISPRVWLSKERRCLARGKSSLTLLIVRRKRSTGSFVSRVRTIGTARPARSSLASPGTAGVPPAIPFHSRAGERPRSRKSSTRHQRARAVWTAPNAWSNRR